jgi:hypothetical protein
MKMGFVMGMIVGLDYATIIMGSMCRNWLNMINFVKIVARVTIELGQKHRQKKVQQKNSLKCRELFHQIFHD